MHTLLEQVRKAKEANLVEDYLLFNWDQSLYVKLPTNTTGKTINHLINHITNIYNLPVRFLTGFLIHIGSDFHTWDREEMEWLDKHR